MINRRKFLGLAGIVLADALKPTIVFGEEENYSWMRSLVDEKDKKKFDNPYEDAVYYINLFHMPVIDNAENDAHGKTHDINSYLRNYFSRNRIGITADGEVIFEKFNGFYLLDGNYCILKEPNISIEQVREFVPNTPATASSYGTYLVNAAAGFSDRPLYILDELTAYINGATYVGRFGGDRFAGVLDFITYSASLGIAVKTKDPEYWKSKNGKDLKDFLSYATRKAFYAEALQTGSQLPYMDIRVRLWSMMDQRQRDFLLKDLGWMKSK